MFGSLGPAKVLLLLQVFFFKQDNPIFSYLFVPDYARAGRLSIMIIFPTEIPDTQKYYAQTLYCQSFSTLPRGLGVLILMSLPRISHNNHFRVKYIELRK